MHKGSSKITVFNCENSKGQTSGPEPDEESRKCPQSKNFKVL